MDKTEREQLLRTLQKNLNILQERNAKYGLNAPLDLLTRIEDHETAIALVNARLNNALTDDELEAKLQPLNLSLDRGGTEIVSGNKYVFQVGALNVPPIPVILIAITTLAILGFISYQVFKPAPPGPAKMSGLFNVAIAQFGEVNSAGQVVPSESGARLSEWVFNSLTLEFETLDLSVKQEFQPMLWHDSLPSAEKGTALGVIVDETAAANLARRINADIVIYGNLVPGESSAAFEPEFYVASLRGEADEIVGRHQLSAPVLLQLPINLDGQAGRALNKKMSDQTRALSHFTIGLMHDLLGSTAEAERIFEDSIQTLNLKSSGGEAIFYYFAGRSALFLGDLEKAEAYFSQANEIDPRYARAHIGLGSVQFEIAQKQPPEERFAAGNLQQSIDHYRQAISPADVSLEPHTAIIGQLALGAAYRLQAETHYALHEDALAEPLFDEAISTLLATIEPMQAAGQQRYLGQTYLSLGATYTQQAIIRQSAGDLTASATLNRQAIEAFDACVAQQQASPFDEVLTRQIIAEACMPYRAIPVEALAQMGLR